MDKVKTQKELAKILNVSPQQVTKYIKKKLVIYDENKMIDVIKTKEKLAKNLNVGYSLRNKRDKQKMADDLLKNQNYDKIKEEDNTQKIVNELNDKIKDVNSIESKIENGTITADEIAQLDFNTLKNFEIYEKYRKNKLDNNERENKLIDRISVENQVELIGKTLLDGINSLPSRLAVLVASKDGDITEIEILLKTELNNLTHEIVNKLKKI